MYLKKTPVKRKFMYQVQFYWFFLSVKLENDSESSLLEL